MLIATVTLWAFNFTVSKYILDQGFQVQAMHMVVPRYVGLYATYGKVFDDFKRNPYEISGGANWYPSAARGLRLNLHLIHIVKSPAASNFRVLHLGPDRHDDLRGSGYPDVIQA